MTDRGGCRLGSVDRWPVAGPCRVDCGHRALVLEARELIALDAEVRRAELEEARWSDDDEGEARRASRPAVTYKTILLDRRARRENDSRASALAREEEEA